MSNILKNNYIFLLISVLIVLAVMAIVFQLVYDDVIERDEGMIEIQTDNTDSEIEPQTVSSSSENVLENIGLDELDEEVPVKGFSSTTINTIEEDINDSLVKFQKEYLAKIEQSTNEGVDKTGELIPKAEVVEEKKNKETGKVEEESKTVKEDVLSPEVQKVSRSYKLILKDVGEPYLSRFGLGPADYQKIKDAGVDIIEGNFDICAASSDVLIFLESAKDAGLMVILPAGAGEAEWGYPCDDNYDENQKPEWEKEKVQVFVKKWAYHPAIYAWDIANEDGQNFPNAQKYDDDFAEFGQAITLKQLQTAYKDVKAVDPSRPIMIRMNGWHFYDNDSNFFRTGNAFGPDVADIVMVNAYSNTDEYFSDLVSVVASRASKAVRAVNSSAKIIIALGAWQEAPMWYLPTVQQFSNDVESAKKTKALAGIGVFKYGAEGTSWWMPENAPQLWTKIPEFFAF